MCSWLNLRWLITPRKMIASTISQLLVGQTTTQFKVTSTLAQSGYTDMTFVTADNDIITVDTTVVTTDNDTI